MVTHHPSVGNSATEVYAAWIRLSKGPQYPEHLIVGWCPCEGVYSYRDGVIYRQHVYHSARGNFATITEATPEELASVNWHIEHNAFQIEARKATGCLGLYKKRDAGDTVKVYHQATGIPYPSKGANNDI